MLKEVQEATILQQNATIGNIVKALNKKVPDCGWFDAIKGTLRPIFWSICNDEGKLVQATASTNSTLHMLSQCVEGFTTAAPAYAAATASSATKLMSGKQVHIQSPPKEAFSSTSGAGWGTKHVAPPSSSWSWAASPPSGRSLPLRA